MDIFVEHTIYASPSEVAAIMFDPARSGEWIANGDAQEVLTPGPLAVGSRVRHKLGVLGWTFPIVTEVKALEPDGRLETAVVEGGHGEIVYQVSPTAGGSIASILVRDLAIATTPHSNWTRKRHMEEILGRLGHLVLRARETAKT